MNDNLDNDDEYEEKILSLAEVFFASRQYEEVLKPFESFLLESPNRIRIILRLAEAYFALKSYDESRRLIERAYVVDAEQITIYALKTVIFLELKEFENAEAEFLIFKTKFSMPNDSHYSILALSAFNARIICYSHMRHTQSEHHLALAICEFNSGKFDYSNGDEVSLLAQQYAMTGDPEKGLVLIGEFLPIFEKNYMVFYARALCYEALGRFDLALIDSKNAKKLGHNNMDEIIEELEHLLRQAS